MAEMGGYAVQKLHFIFNQYDPVLKCGETICTEILGLLELLFMYCTGWFCKCVTAMHFCSLLISAVSNDIFQ